MATALNIVCLCKNMRLCITAAWFSLRCCIAILHKYITSQDRTRSHIRYPACVSHAQSKVAVPLTGLFRSHSRLQNQDQSALLPANQLTPALLFLLTALRLLVQAAFQTLSFSLSQLFTPHQMHLFKLLPLRRPCLAGTTMWALSPLGQSGSPQNWRTCKLR